MLLASSGAWAGQLDDFCKRWIVASRDARSYDEALALTLRDLDADNQPGDWGKVLKALSHASPADHLLILRGYAADIAQPFNCEPFEFPGGRPGHRVELDGEAAAGIEAFAVEGGVVFSFKVERTSKGERGVVQRGKKAISTELPALRSPSVLLAAGVVLVASPDGVWSVPRDGGAPKSLAKLERAAGFTVDGKRLLFASRGKLQALQLSGGAVVTVAELDETPYDTHIAAGPGGVLVAAAGVLTRIDRKGAVTEAARQPLAWFDDRGAVVRVSAPEPRPARKSFRSLGDAPPASKPETPPGLYRVGFDGAAPVRLGEPLELTAAVSRGNAAWGFDRADWVGRGRVVRVDFPAGAVVQVAAPVGVAHELQLDGTRVYWFDSRFRALYSAAAN